MQSRAHPSLPLATLLGPYTEAELADVAVTDVCLDSRTLAAGALFLALAGTRGHGLDHIEHALAGGAAAIAYEPADGLVLPRSDVPLVPVPGLTIRAGEIAADFYGRPSDTLFTTGITGTDGKTSCAWLLARAMGALDMPCGYIGTLGFGDPAHLSLATHTTPDATRIQHWLARIAAGGATAAAMEVSSHALAQHRTDAVAFDVAVLTQISRDHLDYHGSDAAYVAAKRRLFEHDSLSHVVLNADDANGRAWLDAAGQRASVTPVAYGKAQHVTAHGAHVHIQSVDAHADGLFVTLATHAGVTRLDTALIGLFHAHNLAACMAVLLARGIDLDQAAQALSSVDGVPGRMQRIDAPRDGAPLVIVDYAHTAGALEAALASVRAHANGRVFCVFGCGGDRDRGKRALMGTAAGAADRVWLTDDNPRGEAPADIVTEIRDGLPAAWREGEQFFVEHRRARAIAAAIDAAGPEDVVLIAGKGHETTQQYGSHIYTFDDRDVAARVLTAGATAAARPVSPEAS